MYYRNSLIIKLGKNCTNTFYRVAWYIITYILTKHCGRISLFWSGIIIILLLWGRSYRYPVNVLNTRHNCDQSFVHVFYDIIDTALQDCPIHCVILLLLDDHQFTLSVFGGFFNKKMSYNCTVSKNVSFVLRIYETRV